MNKNLLLSSILILSSQRCCLSYDHEYIVEDYFHYSVCFCKADCFMGDVEWQKDNNHKEFTIPKTYNGIKINRLGGYFGRGVPTPFCVTFYDENIEYVTDENEKDTDYETIQLKINIQENITDISYTVSYNYFGKNIYDENGDYISSDIIYKLSVYYEVSKENTVYHSIDGIVYDKDNNEILNDL